VEARATINRVRPLMIIYSSYPAIQPGVAVQYNTVMNTVSTLQTSILPVSEGLVLKGLAASQDDLDRTQPIVISTTSTLSEQVNQLYNAIMAERKKQQTGVGIGRRSVSALDTPQAESTFEVLTTSNLYGIQRFQSATATKSDIDRLCIQLQSQIQSSKVNAKSTSPQLQLFSRQYSTFRIPLEPKTQSKLK